MIETGKMNCARRNVVHEFSAKVLPLLPRTNEVKVAVISGSEREPELQVILEKYPDVSFKLFGLDEDLTPLDLNEVAIPHELEKFDLVLCSQVLEHTWNHANAVQILSSMVAESGVLWLAAPCANRPHDLPEYYVAGMTSQYLSNLCKASGLTVLGSGELGSARLYSAAHNLPTWLSINSHRLPLFHAFDEYPLWHRIWLRFRYLPNLIGLHFKSPRITPKLETAVESWVLASK